MRKGLKNMAFDFVRDRFEEAERSGDTFDIEVLVEEMRSLVERGEALIAKIEAEYPLEDDDDENE